MPMVNTVLGPVSADDLGATLIHEHLVLGHPGWECDALAAPYNREVIATVCSEALEEVKAYGVKTMVDASPIDLNRDVELARMVSERTGLNIIVATGMYMEAMGNSAHFRFRGAMADTTTEMCETFVKEITQGIGDSGIKPGVIKVATGHGEISSYEERVLRAAARAQKETGVPIITHTEGGTMGPEQADILISEGADPRRIMIGHIGGNANLQYHTSVLDRGVYIAFDRLGIDIMFPDTLRKACIIGLVGIGYADRIMLSHDYAPYWLGRSTELPEIAKALMANWSYSHVFKNIVPALGEAGVTEEKIESMLVDNPRRLFGGG